MKHKRFFSIILLTYIILPNYFLHSQNLPDFRVNETVSPDGSEQSSPAIAGNGAGIFVITWEDNRLGFGDDIYAQIYMNNYIPSGCNFKVNDDSTFSSQYSPEVGIDLNGNFIIVWIDGRGGEWNVYAQRFQFDGTPCGQNFRVNDDSGNEDHEHASVSIDGEGNFVIVWADKRNGNWDIYCQLYSNSGFPIGSNFKINDDTGDAIQYWPCCDRQADGKFAIAWADQRNGSYDIYFQQFTNEGIAIGNNNKVNDDAGIALQFLPEISIDLNGNIVITWTDERNNNRDIFCQRYFYDGTPAGQNFLINDDNTNTVQQWSYIATDSDGNFTVCWEDSRNTVNDIYARNFSNLGVPAGVSYKVNDDTLNVFQYYAGITNNHNGFFTITWEDHRLGNRGDIFLQHYDSTGFPVLTNEKVNDDYGSENQGTPSIAVSGNDGIIVVWADSRYEESDIFAQRFTGNGDLIGINFKVNDDTGYFSQYEPSVAADATGNVMVVWTDYRSGYPSNIYAQVYAPDGSAVGSNFQVDNAGAYMHYSPVVAAAPNGGFVVTWWDTNDGGSNVVNVQLPGKLLKNWPKRFTGSQFSYADVWAQRFSTEGEPLGGNFLVNDVSEDVFHAYPDIAVHSDGSFIIAWCDDRDGEEGIYFQRYSSDGAPQGVNTKVISLSSGVFQRTPSVAAIANEGFIISWMDYQPSATRILAQRFSHDGNTLGEILEVSNSVENTFCYSPTVDADETGNFTICWYCHNFNVYNVFARRYENSGYPVGDIYGMASSGNSFQIFPDVTMQNNRIFSAWQDNRGGQTGFDIWANVFEWGSWVEINNDHHSEISFNTANLQVYPNPFKNQAIFKFIMQENGNANLIFTDHIGRLVKTLSLGEFNYGKHEIPCEFSGLFNGLYFCTLWINGEMTGRVKILVEN